MGAAEPRLKVRSKTRIDTGRWWRSSPLWLCVTDDELVLFAASRRKYLQRLPITDCRDSHYCHITGELVIEAAVEMRFSRFVMPPTDALRVLDALEGGVSASHAGNAEADAAPDKIAPNRAETGT